MWKHLSERISKVVMTPRGKAEKAALLAHVRRIEETCDDIRYTRLPAVGGTAHVLEVIHRELLFKTVGRTRLEAYEKMIEHLEGETQK